MFSYANYRAVVGTCCKLRVFFCSKYIMFSKYTYTLASVALQVGNYNNIRFALPLQLYFASIDSLSFQVLANDGLPKNICHRCLYLTEMYTDFAESVRQCEIKLQNFIVSSYTPKPAVQPSQTERPVNGALTINSDDSVTVIDPAKEYQSSDDEGSASDVENTFTAPLPVKQKNTKVNRFKTQQIKNIFFCEYCDQAFVSQEECFRHELNNHDQANPHICTFCTFRCASRNTIIAHIKECHDPKPFLCTQCDKKFGRRSDLRKHSVVHTGIRKFRGREEGVYGWLENIIEFFPQVRFDVRFATRTSREIRISPNTCVFTIRSNCKKQTKQFN